MFLDSSAVIALILGEPESEELDRRIAQSENRLITSPIVVVESALNLARITKASLQRAADLVDAVLPSAHVHAIDITPEIGRRALVAYTRFGKGTGHPARLNLADAFTYACAEHHDVLLLYKGDDFSRTDLGGEA